MTKLIIGLLAALAIVAVKVLTWYYSDDAKLKRQRNERDKAHAANARKDGKGLGRWFNKHRRR